jgi:GT2 family glycosyltransferase
VVVATRDRRTELCRTLDHLAALPERPPVVVVDNGSRDGTPQLVRDFYPGTGLVRLARNVGASARNLGVLASQTRYVAFSDDDSWWEPGSLAAATGVLDAHPRVGVVAARILVGPQSNPDPVSQMMAESPLPRGNLPGPRVLGFLACAAVVRREPFLAAGGFSPLLFFGGEEELLACDLAAAGWEAVFRPDIVARHYPSATRHRVRRDYLQARNRLLVAWLRRPAGAAWRTTAVLARRALRDPLAALALAGALACLPRALAGRRVVPPDLEAAISALERKHPP